MTQVVPFQENDPCEITIYCKLYFKFLEKEKKKTTYQMLLVNSGKS